MREPKPLKQTEEQRQATAAYWAKVRSIPVEALVAAESAPATPDQLLRLSRLTTEEQARTFADIKGVSADTTGEVRVLRQAARRLVQRPAGWWMLVGPPGNAKSLILSVIVAEACRKGIAAQYYNASEVDRATKPPDILEDGTTEYERSPDAFKRMAKRLPVLAIDECDKLNWTPWQIQHIGEILEQRHRDAAAKLTIFAANLPPTMWSNADHLWHMISRFNDGRFRMIWHGDNVPTCLSQYREGDDHFIPAIFNITLPDMRTALPARRD